MRRLSLAGWIAVGLLAGVGVGLAFPGFSSHLQPLATVFLRLIRMVVGPLVFATLVVGIAGQGTLRQVGRIGIKAFVYFELVTTAALLLGVAAVNLAQPGRGLHLSGPAASLPPGPAQGLLDSLLLHLVPQSFFEALAQGEILQIVVFSVLFSMAASQAGARARPMVAFCESLAQIMFRLTEFVMWVAPVGVFGAVGYSLATHGVAVLLPLLRLVVTFYATLFVFVVVVLGGVALLVRLPLRRFYHAVREPVLIAFSTASSEAALPKALENMEALGVSRRVVGFVLPTGYSFNLDGTTLYLALAALFTAQVGGLHLSLGRQLVVVLTLMVTSKGVAGVARAAIVVLLATATSLGLPLEAVAMLLGIDQILDMGRTAVNVLGNCLAAVVVARWEGEVLAPPVAGDARVETA